MDENPFSVEQPSHSLGFALWQATTLWQRQLKRVLDPFDVSHAQFVLMASLLWFEHQGKKISQIDLIKHSKLDKMTVSKSLLKLQSMGYITRLQSEQDTRAKIATLTMEGEKMAAKLVRLIEAEDARFFNQLTFKKQKSLLECFLELSR